MTLAVDRLNEDKERVPCLSDEPRKKMWGVQRRVALDLALMGFGLGTWLGVNGVYVQLPLLVERQPERWALPASMALAVQLANSGLVLYALLKRLLPRVTDSVYIYALLGIGAAALTLNAFLHDRTAPIGGADTSVAFLSLTFCVALVGCTSSVLFYPYLRHYRDVYLNTYLVGEGLSGFLPSLLALVQGVGGDPECVHSPDNSTVHAVYPPPRFDTTVFLLLLAVLAALSLASFALVDRWPGFRSERVQTPAADKSEEVAVDKSEEAAVDKSEEAAGERVVLLRRDWLAALATMVALNALMNGVLTSVQSFSCMPYGARAYHLAVTLSAMANPTACLAGVWLRPLSVRALTALLAVAAGPLAYILATALLSPAPPLQGEPIGEALVVLSWLCVSAILSYARMWVYTWARRGAARGMRAVGAVGQAGSAAGAALLFVLVNHTTLFTQPQPCASPA